jgi:hypothetical protein
MVSTVAGLRAAGVACRLAWTDAGDEADQRISCGLPCRFVSTASPHPPPRPPGLRAQGHRRTGAVPQPSAHVLQVRRGLARLGGGCQRASRSGPRPRCVLLGRAEPTACGAPLAPAAGSSMQPGCTARPGPAACRARRPPHPACCGRQPRCAPQGCSSSHHCV